MPVLCQLAESLTMLTNIPVKLKILAFDLVMCEQLQWAMLSISIHPEGSHICLHITQVDCDGQVSIFFFILEESTLVCIQLKYNLSALMENVQHLYSFRQKLCEFVFMTQIHLNSPNRQSSVLLYFPTVFATRFVCFDLPSKSLYLD